MTEKILWFISSSGIKTFAVAFEDSKWNGHSYTLINSNPTIEGLRNINNPKNDKIFFKWWILTEKLHDYTTNMNEIYAENF